MRQIVWDGTHCQSCWPDLGSRLSSKRCLIVGPVGGNATATALDTTIQGGVKRVDAHSTYVVEDAAYSNIKDARIDDDGNTPTFLFPTRPFRHMGMESMSVLACAMNEALLQSHDGTIRVAPAVTDTQIARFTLHARGGFIVSSEITDGKPLWIAIESVLGNNCKLQIPWPTAYVFENGKLVDRHSNGTIEFQTGKGRIFTLVPNSDAIESWDVCHYRVPAERFPEGESQWRCIARAAANVLTENDDET